MGAAAMVGQFAAGEVLVAAFVLVERRAAAPVLDLALFQLADRIAVLDHGHIVAAGTADEFKSLVPGGHVRLTFIDAAGT